MKHNNVICNIISLIPRVYKEKRAYATRNEIVDESAGYAIFSQPRTREIGMNTVILAIYCEIIRRAPSIPGKSKQDTCSMLVQYSLVLKRGVVLSGKTSTSVAASAVCRKQCAHTSPLSDKVRRSFDPEEVHLDSNSCLL